MNFATETDFAACAADMADSYGAIFESMRPGSVINPGELGSLIDAAMLDNGIELEDWRKGEEITFAAAAQWIAQNR